MQEHYIYQADVLCRDCGINIKTTLDKAGKTPTNPADETTWDSDEYPKGPYIDGEADSARYCADCGEFLENELTDAGERYVFQQILEVLADPADETAVERIETLVEFYEVDLQDLIRHSYEVARENCSENEE